MLRTEIIKNCTFGLPKSLFQFDLRKSHTITLEFVLHMFYNEEDCKSYFVQWLEYLLLLLSLKYALLVKYNEEWFVKISDSG